MHDACDPFGFQRREYTVEKWGTVLRLKRERVAARLYVSDKHVVDVLHRWLQRGVERRHPDAVLGREVVVRIAGWTLWERQPWLIAYARAIRRVHPDDRDAVVPYIDTGTRVVVPVMQPPRIYV